MGKYIGNALCYFSRIDTTPQNGCLHGNIQFFIVLPQIINAIIGGPLVKYVYGGDPVYALVISGLALIIAAVAVFRVNDIDEVPIKETL